MSNKRDDKQAGGEIAVQSPFVKWLDNFWYHYKWHVIIGAFFLFVIVWCTVQCTQRDVSETYITLAGGYELTDEQQNAVEKVFNSLAQGKQGSDAIDIGVRVFPYFSEQELKTEYTDPETGALNEMYYTAQSYNAQRYEELKDFTMTGSCSVWLLSEAAYEQLNMKNTLAVPLSEVFSQKPSAAYDNYAIRLGSTALYEYYPALQVLPADTLVVLSGRVKLFGSTSEKEYEQVKDVFREIVEFKIPGTEG